jgi:hypothetical protein
MTPEQRYDRLERIARLMYEDALRASRESRKQTDLLSSYVDAQREYELAKLAIAVKPEDSETTETLRKAREVLDRAREELKH